MMDELTPTQALALWGLLARQGRAKATKVKPKADRDALVAQGFVEVEAASKTVALTDRGWNWAGTHFDAPLPPAQKPLQDLLLRLGAHLQANGETLADFIGEAPPVPAPAAKAKRPAKEKAPPRPKAPPKPKAPTAAVLRRRIEEAYLRASDGERSESVRLSRLRAELGDLDRKTVDAGLARIVKAKTETASLSQISDNKAIDPAEREAAFSPAGEPFHLIRIR
ncbi:MAG: hypothetical protein ACRYGP_23650 [Janthinobacterium lividum]